MKNNGFTLIELLAVITILSIILLIVFASVTTIMKNSKNSLQKSQIEEIEKAAEYYNNEEGLKNYDICINVEELIEKGYIKEDKIIDPKTGKETTGSVKIKYNGKKYSYEYQEKVCYYTYINLLEDIAPAGLSEGDKYEYQVNDTDTFKFYVLSIEDDKVNLIMDRNICNDGTAATETNKCLIGWYTIADNRRGPVTAMQGLYKATKNWNNVPDMDLSGNKAYFDEGHIANSSFGYGKIETTEAGIKIISKDGITEVTGSNNQTPAIPYETNKPLKARLPKKSEVYNSDTTDKTHCHDDYGSCPAWLTNGLASYSSYYPENEHIEGIYSYWILSSFPGTSGHAHNVYYYGEVSNGIVNNDYTSTANSNGVRAVITVSMSDLS